jgi:hypothetical protein
MPYCLLPSDFCLHIIFKPSIGGDSKAILATYILFLISSGIKQLVKSKYTCYFEEIKIYTQSALTLKIESL